jgi:hypothetical protein
MPILNNRYDYVKVFRPKGTRFVETNVKRQASLNVLHNILVLKFAQEFEREPDLSKVVIEMVYSDTNIHATLFEVAETPDPPFRVIIE